jgi:hypothetical protein
MRRHWMVLFLFFVLASLMNAGCNKCCESPTSPSVVAHVPIKVTATAVANISLTVICGNGATIMVTAHGEGFAETYTREGETEAEARARVQPQAQADADAKANVNLQLSVQVNCGSSTPPVPPVPVPPTPVPPTPVPPVPPTPTPCTYILTPTSRNFDYTGGSDVAQVTTQTGCTWSPNSNATYLMVSGSGSGSGFFSYSITANTGGVRQGLITVGGQVLVVTQNAMPVQTACEYALVSTVNVNYPAGNGGIVVSTNRAGCAWNAVSNNTPNLTLTNASGSMSGSFNFTHTANAGPERIFTISFTGVNFSKTVTVIQAGAPITPSCGFAVDLGAGQLNYTYVGGNNGTVISATPGCTWTVESSAFWAEIKTGTSGAGNGNFTFLVAGYTGTVTRTLTLTVRGQGGFIKTFTVTQTARP